MKFLLVSLESLVHITVCKVIKDVKLNHPRIHELWIVIKSSKLPYASSVYCFSENSHTS